jgi:predicted negative regulator of RcsB-dependent stress response
LDIIVLNKRIGANVLSLKENISMVKNELNTEEKLFASAVKLEHFFTKYKYILISAVILLIIIVAVSVTRGYLSSINLKASNAAFLKLQQNPNDTASLKILENDNKQLYAIYLLNKAVKDHDSKTLQALSTSKVLFVSDMASYYLASMQESLSGLNSYENRSDALYKQFAVLQNAYLLIQQHKNDEANRKLQTIPQGSPINQVAKILSHYSVK